MAIGRKTGGRKPGSKNKVTDSMRRDILSVYRKLGGKTFLFEWAEENKTEYVKQCLSRVMPAPPRPEQDEEANPVEQIRSDMELARRIAFVLAKAEAATVKDITPAKPAIEAEKEPAVEAQAVKKPEPEPVKKAKAVKEPEQEIADKYPAGPQPLDYSGKDPSRHTIETYPGSAQEQGLETQQSGLPYADWQRNK